MSERLPWWYSQPGAAADPSDRSDTGQKPRIDVGAVGGLAGLATGAQQLVEFARQALLAPHAGHAEPAEHPDCVVCRTMIAFGEGRRSVAPDLQIHWIDLDPPLEGP